MFGKLPSLPDYVEAYAEGWRACAALAAIRIRAHESSGADDAIRELEHMAEEGPVPGEVSNG